MKKLKSHDDLKELRVGDLTTWHLAVDTSDVMPGPLSAALWRLQHNDIEAGGKKKKGFKLLRWVSPSARFL